MAEVILKNVVKIYPGNIKAVDDVNLHIYDEEFIVLVGPSGCGKSTTLRMIAGLEEITEGTIQIEDRIVNDVPPKNRDIAMVFQNYALYPHMTVYKNMGFALKLRKYPRKEIDKRVREAAAILSIEELLERKPKALSGGQRQRVAVGRAIVRQPKAFLFDEPLSNLDAKLRVEMRAELKRLHHQLRTTTIYVTHDQEEAMTLGERIVVMNDGVIQQCGEPLEIYHSPANRFVAGFVGTPPMNLMEGELESEDGNVYVNVGDGNRLKILPEMAKNISDWIGKDIVFGVRPEAMDLHSEGRFAGEENILPVKVSVLEFLGEKMDLSTATPSQPHIIARVDAERGIKADDTVNLHFDMKSIHLFAPGEFGKNFSLRKLAAV